jgi:hypothetical protein
MVTNLPAFPPIWLNELLADNITSLLDNIGEHDPWVELHNSGPEPIPLDNCYLSDSYSNLARWPFPAGATIPAGGFLVVWCDGQPEQTSSGSLHASFRLPSGHGSLALSRLLNGSHQILDYLNYTNLPANWSYGDFPDGQPFYRSAMFAATPGTSNTNTSPPLIVFINEWMTDNNSFLADAADQQFEDWFELFNPGDAPVDLGGYFLTDNLNEKFQFRVPDNGHYRIPSRGYLLVWADNDPGQNSTNLADLHVNFALNKDGEEIGLFAADGTMIDAMVSGPQAENASEGRFPDGSATINPLPKPTPRNANVVANSAPTLAAISDRVVTLGQTLTFNVFATDADQPPQSLNFSLADAPSEASIHPTTGRFSWTPLSAPVTSAIKVIVSDSGEPSLTATQTFVVVVVQPPALESAQVSAGQFSFSWMTLPGQKFQLEHTSDLEDTAWQPVGEPLTGTGGPLGFAISADEAERKFYRLRILP